MAQIIRADAVAYTGFGSGGGGGGGNVRSGGCANSNEAIETGTMALERLRTMLNVPPANRLPDWVNPLEKIEQLLTCAICLDRYKNPKLLPCQHSFCMDPCLDGLIDIVRRSVRCPECRAEHPLPYEGVKAFQTNYTLMGFLEIHLQASEENASELESYIRRYNLERCKVCDEKSEVEYCPHCEKRICLECKSTHVDMMKRDLGRLMNQVKRLCTRITDTADTLARGADSLTVNCDNVKEEIRDYVKRYTKELKKREDALICEVEAFFNAETRMIKTVRDNLELESSNINEACARVDACLKGEREMSDDELVRFKQMFTDGLEYLRTVNPDADELTNKKLRFVVNDAHLLPHAITQFGELQICTPQYNHKLPQAEQIYVPKFLQLGLESDHYLTKRRPWDPNDSNTWQQQQQPVVKPLQTGQQKLSDDDAYSSRYRRRQLLEEQAWNRIRGEYPQQQQQRQQWRSPKCSNLEDSGNTRTTTTASQFDNSPWSRVQRINDQQQQQNAETTTNISNDSGCTALAPSEPAPAAALPPLPPSSNSTGVARRAQMTAPSPQKAILKQQERKPSAEDQQLASTAEEASTPTTPTGTDSLIPRPTQRMPKTTSASSPSINADNSKTGGGRGAPPAATTKEKSPSADRELDQRVANIRKEYEQRQEEQQKTILQIQQRVRAHRMPVDVAGAATASSEEEEEDENQRETDGEPIRVHIYPRPEENNVAGTQDQKASVAQASLRVSATEATTATASTVADTPRKTTFPFVKSNQQQQPQQTNGLIDWKKYLIPTPSEDSAKTASSGRRSSAAAASSSAVNEIVHRNVESSTTTFRPPTESRSFNADESSWIERRRRFVRSKTNPDFSVDVNSNTASHAIADAARTSRYLPDHGESDHRRRRYGGVRNDSAGNQENNYSSTNAANSRESAERGSSAKSRYRRKTERSHSGYAVNNTCESNDNGLHHVHSTDPSRFEIAIGTSSNADAAHANAAGGPGMRFYRVFTNPKIDYLSKGRCVQKFGCKGNGDGLFNWPRGVAIVPTTEEIVVCDSSNHRLQIFDKRGRFMKTMGTYGTGRSEFDCLAGVCINKYRQFVVSDRYNHRVQIFDSSGRHLREFGAHGQTNGRFSSPWGVTVDQQGYIYVCDKDNHRVQIFQADGNFVGKFGGIGNRQGQFQNPHFVACNRQNQLIVSDSSNHRVQVFDHNGHFLFSFGSEGFHEGQFKYPRGVAVDEQGFIVVADSGNNRIQIFYPDGRFYSTFGGWGSADGQLKGVEGVALTMDGKIVVADRENHRIQVF